MAVLVDDKGGSEGVVLTDMSSALHKFDSQDDEQYS
jgi:hypothetical protein